MWSLWNATEEQYNALYTHCTSPVHGAHQTVQMPPAGGDRLSSALPGASGAREGGAAVVVAPLTKEAAGKSCGLTDMSGDRSTPAGSPFL
jgi:hypothetical protein